MPEREVPLRKVRVHMDCDACGVEMDWIGKQVGWDFLHRCPSCGQSRWLPQRYPFLMWVEDDGPAQIKLLVDAEAKRMVFEQGRVTLP